MRYRTAMEIESPVQILFDGTFLGNPSGIGRDSRNLLSAAKLSYGDKIEIVYPAYSAKLKFTIRGKKTSHLVSKIAQLSIVLGRPQNVLVPPNSVYIQSHLYGPIPIGENLKHILRVHDIFPISNPIWFKKISVKLFNKLFFSLPSDTRILCDSKSTQSEVRRVRPDLSDVRVAYCPVQIPKTESCENCSLCIDGFKSNKTYFVSIGTIEPRKNYDSLIDFWTGSDFCRERGFELIILGKKGWKSKKLCRLLQKNSINRITWIRDACDHALFLVLKDSIGLISLSHAEGFNLPVAEAILSGVPVLLSKNNAHEEIYGDIGHFLIDQSAESFEQSLKKLVEGEKRSALMIDNLAFDQAMATVAKSLMINSIDPIN